MFGEIILAMRKSIKHTTLDVFRVDTNKSMRDFIKCNCRGKLTDNEVDDCKYFTRTIKEDVYLLYVFVDRNVTAKDIMHDIADRDDTTYIILYRYLDSIGEDDAHVVKSLSIEARTIVRCIYGYKLTPDSSTKENELFENFDKTSSRDKLILLAPYIIVCKIFEGVNIGLHTGGNFILQKAINPRKYDAVDKVINFILKEEPSVEALFNLNAFMLPFADNVE